MKQMKKILYLLAMLIAIIVLIFAGTGIVQTGLVIISKKMQIAMSEDLLYHISGSCGVMIAGIICGFVIGLTSMGVIKYTKKFLERRI